jgi:hypothetical protein
VPLQPIFRSTLGRVDLLFKPEEGTDKVEKAQEVSGQFIKTRKYSLFINSRIQKASIILKAYHN